jgi:hypothetical protein
MAGQGRHRQGKSGSHLTGAGPEAAWRVLSGVSGSLVHQGLNKTLTTDFICTLRTIKLRTDSRSVYALMVSARLTVEARLRRLNACFMAKLVQGQPGNTSIRGRMRQVCGPVVTLFS